MVKHSEDMKVVIAASNHIESDFIDERNHRCQLMFPVKSLFKFVYIIWKFRKKILLKYKNSFLAFWF